MRYEKAFTFTVFGVVLMSFESLLIKMTSIPAQSLTFYFGLLMFASTNGVLLIQQKSHFFELYQQEFKPILLSALFMGTSNFFFVLAIKNTTVASAVFILSSSPLISALIAFVLFRTKTPKRIFIATFFVFCGLFLILIDDLNGGRWQGNLYAFLCVISFSSLFSVLERYKKISRLACIGGGGLMAAFLAGITSAIVLPDAYSFGVIFFMGAILTPISRVFIGVGTKILPSSDVTLLTIIETVLAPIWVWIFLSETPTPNTLWGGVIIIIALVLNGIVAHRSFKREHPKY